MKHLIKISEKAQHFGEIFTMNFFIEMLNPKYRGPNFTWERFPIIVTNMVASNVFTCFDNKTWDKYNSFIRDEAIGAAQRTSQRCLIESDIGNWLPLPNTLESERGMMDAI